LLVRLYNEASNYSKKLAQFKIAVFCSISNMPTPFFCIRISDMKMS
jgi:hypothetical protein